MRKVREIIRLDHHELSQREIARVCDVSPTTVKKVLEQAKSTAINWSQAESMTEAQLELALRAPDAPCTALCAADEPDWAAVWTALKKKGNTRKLLWSQYHEAHPAGYRYSQFCHHLSVFKDRLEPVLRQEYKAGEKLFVDWAGLTLAYSEEGRSSAGHVFVATFGASNYTFAQVYADETLPNWIQAHIEAFELFGGVPQLVVPDNLKTGVTRANYYDPDLNRTYHDLAEHYQVGVLPTRSLRPRDKPKVETGVLIVEREIMAPLRQQTWLSLGELREAFSVRLQALNARPFSLLAGSRASAFAELDQPLLRPLPDRRFTFGRWHDVTVAKDYHVQVEKHFYSVPYRFLGERVQAHVSGQSVEIYRRGERIAVHTRSTLPGKATTDAAHRPEGHNALLNRTTEEYIARAAKIGPATALALEQLIGRYPHQEMAFRACEGVLRLARQYGRERMEAACETALTLDEPTYKTLENLLRNNRENHWLPDEPPAINHTNIRGSDYYRGNR